MIPPSSSSSRSSTALTTTTTTTSARSSSIDNNNKDYYYSPLALERALYIRGVLTQRLSHVGSGKRLRDFEKWVMQNGGEAQVWSMHGRTAAATTTVTATAATTDDDSSFSSSKKKRRGGGRGHGRNGNGATGGGGGVGLWLFGGGNNNDDPFPMDRTNLDIVATSLEAPPSQFPPNHPKQYLLDDDDAGSPSVVALVLRAMRLSIHFAPVLCTSGLALVSPTFRRNVWYRWMASCIGSAGAAWIKWGQWSSTRSDMFPEALCDELASLHNGAPAHSFEISQLAVESSLGLAPGTLLQVFDQFDVQPLASGSIAQVHKALLDGTTLVAVKIRHARVAQLMACDFRLMRFVAQTIEALVPMTKWLHLTASVNQFSYTMAQQGDLHVEAHHLEVLNYNFKKWPTVRFPKPFYASSSVIIETFEPGRIVTDLLDTYDAWAALMNLENAKEAAVVTTTTTTTPSLPQYDHTAVAVTQQQQQQQPLLIQGNELIPMDICKFLVVTGINIYLKMLLVDNLMHADLHPGNIMIDVHRLSTSAQQGLPSLHAESLAMVNNNNNNQGHRWYQRRARRPQHARRNLGLTLVDAGMVAQLTNQESAIFIGLLSSLGAGDGQAAADFALQFSDVPQNNDSDNDNNNNNHNHNNGAILTNGQREEFYQDMEDLFAERCRGYNTGVDVGHVLRGVLGLIRKHHITIDANFATLVVNILCIESLARRLFPTYNSLDAARPLLESYRNLCYKKSKRRISNNSNGNHVKALKTTPIHDARKSRFVQAWLALMYIRKQRADDRFFAQQYRLRKRLEKEQQRQQRLLLQQQSRRQRRLEQRQQ